MRWGVALLFVIGLTGCYVSGTSGERPGTTTSATPTVTQTYTVNTDTDSLTYTLTVPATWMLVRGDGAELRFQEAMAPATPLDPSDDQAYIGGVNILDQCSNASTVDQMYACVLPNHSTDLAMKAVTSPAGEGRVYMLEHSYPVGDQRRWWAQHALIPVDRYIFDIWIQVGPETADLPVDALTEMVNTFQVTVSHNLTPSTPRVTPAAVSATLVAVRGLSGATALAAGNAHICALLQTGTVQCWGRNESGQLGDGTSGGSRATPVAVRGLSGVTALAAGSAHTCALLQTGTVQCWGLNDNGQLGDGTTANRATPVAVRGLSGVTALAAGGAHTCALLQTGTAQCWGSNFSGQLGDGTTTDRLTPAVVSGLSGVTALAAGWDHTCAVLQTGTVQCWGSNFSGQLGDGTTTDRLTPVAVSGLSGVTALAAGGAHTCALLPTGTVQCWGRNESGQLGDGTTANRVTPVAVSGLSGATALAVGGAHTCALLPTGTAQCWGRNESGRLGDGTSGGFRATPVVVSGLSGATALAAGGAHTCALLQTGTAQCWGENRFLRN
jgi:alpha-tubulin suppressor-like RCC1 family protein